MLASPVGSEEIHSITCQVPVKQMIENYEHSHGKCSCFKTSILMNLVSVVVLIIFN